MSKCVAAGMLGFLIGMKCRDCGKQFCTRQLKKQAMKLIGVK